MEKPVRIDEHRAAALVNTTKSFAKDWSLDPTGNWSGYRRKTISGATRRYLYIAGWQVLEERLGASTAPDRQCIWGPRYIDELILRDRNATGGGNLGKTGSGLDERLYALQDPNWNVVALTNAAGTVVERYRYDAYGKSTTLTPTFTSRAASNYDWETRYTGQRHDGETSLMQYRNRYYDTRLGRFVTRDPIGYATGDVNLYRYVGNDPANHLDLSGLEKHHWFMLLRPKKTGQARVDMICKAPKININRYTTAYTKEEHGFIHLTIGIEVTRWPYKGMYMNLLDSSTDCCSFLIGVEALMIAWHVAIRQAQQEGKLPGQVGRLDLTSYWAPPPGKLPVSTAAEFMGKVNEACGCSDQQKIRTKIRVTDNYIKLREYIFDQKGLELNWLQELIQELLPCGPLQAIGPKLPPLSIPVPRMPVPPIPVPRVPVRCPSSVPPGIAAY